MAKSVLDASALLAFFSQEPGADAVEQAIRAGAFISTVNLAEVLTKVSDIGNDPERFHAQLVEQGILGGNIVVKPLREGDAVAISKLRSKTKRLGLSLGDRACLALGAVLRLPVLTADKDWLKLDLGVEIRVIR
jgi:ribonuclease VapC